MTEDLINQPDNNSRGFLSGITITLFSAIIAVLFFALFMGVAYTKKMPIEKLYFARMFLQITAVVVAVGMTQFLSRKIQGDRLGFMQAFLGGWMSSLMLGMLTALFYSIFYRVTELPLMPEGGFAILLIFFSALGLFISLLLSFIFKKEN